MTGRKYAAIVAAVCVLVLAPRGATAAGFLCDVLGIGCDAPPSPAIEITCDPALLISNWDHLPLCKTAGRANRGEVIIVKGRNFAPGFLLSQNGTRLLKDEKRVNGVTFLPNPITIGNDMYPALQVRGDGTFVINIITPTAGELRDERNAIRLGAYDLEVATYNSRDSYHKGERASARLEITDESRLPPPGAEGGFSFKCAWTEWSYDEDGNQTRSEKTSATECPQGAEFEVAGGPVPRAERGRWGTLEWLGIAPDGACPRRSDLTDRASCIYLQGNAFVVGRLKGRYGVAQTPEEKERERTMCKMFPNPKVGGADSSCEVQHVGYVPREYPEGSLIRLTLLDAREPAWRVAGPSFVVKKEPKIGEKTYPTKYFSVEIDATNLITTSAPWDYPTLVPKHLEKGKALAGQAVTLPVRWVPQGNGGPKSFPLGDRNHALELVLDEGNDEKKLDYRTIDVKENEWTLAFTVPGNLDTKSPHTLTVRCAASCASVATAKDPDPEKPNKYWKTAYDPARVRLDVVGLEALHDLPSLAVRPDVAKPGDTITITGKNLPADGKIEALLIENSKGEYLSSEEPGENYALIVPGREKAKPLMIPVDGNGNVTVALPLPKAAGKLVPDEGKVTVQAHVLEKGGARRIKVRGELAINDSDCALTSAAPSLSFWRSYDEYKKTGDEITPSRPLAFARNAGAHDIFVNGKGFFCETALKRPVVSWANEGIEAEPMEISEKSDLFSLQRWPGAAVFDGSFTGNTSMWWGWFLKANQLRVSNIRLAVQDGKKKKAEAVVPITLPYRAEVLPEENDGKSIFQRGDVVRVKMWGFPTSRQLVMKEWGDPLQKTWDTKIDAEFTKKTNKRIYSEGDPSVIDVRVPWEIPKGTHRFIVADVSEGLQSSLGYGFTLPEYRPRASFFVNVGMEGGPEEGTKKDEDKKEGGEKKRKGLVTVVPNVAAQGDAIKITAEGFAPLALLEITLAESKVSSIGDYSSNQGKLGKTVKIPPYFKNGEYAVIVKDTDGAVGTAKITVRGKEKEPTFFIVPYQGVPGTPVNLEGENWDHDAKRVYMQGDDPAAELSIDVNGCNWVLDKKACAEGALRLIVTIPEGTPLGIYAIAVESPSFMKGAPFEVLKVPEKKNIGKPYITLTPQKGGYRLVTISGGNLAPKAGVTMLFDGEKMGIAGGYAATDDAGTLAGVSIAVPQRAKPGVHAVTVKDGKNIVFAEYTLGEEKDQPEERPKADPQPEPQKEPAPPGGAGAPGAQGSYGNMETRTYGDESVKSYGDGVQAPAYGNIETKTYGDVGTKAYGDVEAKKYGDVQAPTYENSYGEPAKEGEPCNPELPKLWQPGCTQSSLKAAGERMASIRSSFSGFFRKIFKKKPVAPKIEDAPFLEIEREDNAPADTPARPPSPQTPARTEAPKKESVKIPAPSPQSSERTAQPAPGGKTISGSFRCWSYNVSGGGGDNCRLFAPIELHKNGTYTMSSESGTYMIQGDIITLSESKIRGPGTLVDGNKIRFEYDYNGWHHVITYLKEGEAKPAEEEPQKPELSAPTPQPASVDLTITYPEDGPTVGWINVIQLKAQGIADGIIHEALAIIKDDYTVNAYFNERKLVVTERAYDVYASSGFGEPSKIGTLDLHGKPGGELSLTLRAAP